MFKISAEVYGENHVYTIKPNKEVDKKYLLEVRIINIQHNLGV